MAVIFSQVGDFLPKRKKIARVSMGVGKRWIYKDGPGKAAAVSFYTLFSAAPLLFFSLLLAEKMLGTELARSSAIAWLGGFISQVEAAQLVDLVRLKAWSGQTFFSSVLIGSILLWATSLVFARLRLGVRDIFDEKSETAMLAFKNGLIGRLLALLLSVVFGMVTAAGFVLVSAIPSLPGMLGDDPRWWQLLLSNSWPALLLTLGGTLLLRWIPDEAPSWSSTLRAASFMLVLYTLGRLLLEIYMQHSTIVSAYGAASALVVFLVWIYFAAQVFFFAATLCEELEAANPPTKQ